MLNLSWINSIPEDQLNVISICLYVGFRLNCVDLTEEDKELMHNILNAFSSKNSEAYRMFLDSVNQRQKVYKKLADS